jgi:uncharacterized membrane protein
MPTTKPLRPDRVFVMLMAAFGPLLVLLTPPMQAPDEPNHLYRIWQLSCGQWISPDYQASVPVDLQWMGAHYARDHARPSPWVAFEKIRHDFHQPLSREPRVQVPIENTSLYSPLAYLPALCGAWVARAFNCSASGFLYCGRFTCMTFYATLGWLTVRFMPVLKWSACIALTAPMSMFQGTVLTADTTAISFTLLATALVLNISMKESRWPIARVVALAAVMVAVALCKTAYAPVALLTLGIPPRKWPGRWWLYPLTIIGACACADGAWIWLVRPLSTSLTSVPSPRLQVRWIEAHPLSLLSVILRTVWHEKVFYLRSALGYFGWLDVFLPMPAIYFFALLYLSSAMTTSDATLLDLPMRLAAAAALMASLGIIFVSEYIVWSGYRAPLVGGVQGRYLIPLALLIPIIAHAHLRPRWGERTVVVIIAGFLVCTLVTIYQFFYHW